MTDPRPISYRLFLVISVLGRPDLIGKFIDGETMGRIASYSGLSVQQLVDANKFVTWVWEPLHPGVEPAEERPWSQWTRPEDL